MIISDPPDPLPPMLLIYTMIFGVCRGSLHLRVLCAFDVPIYFRHINQKNDVGCVRYMGVFFRHMVLKKYVGCMMHMPIKF
jgi:hypothetical protein